MNKKCRVFINFLLAFTLVLTLFFSGCLDFLTTSTATTTHTTSTYSTTPPPTTSHSPLTNDEVLFSDDFSNSKSGWLTGPKESGDYYYESGEYSLLELKERYLIYATLNKKYSDFAIEVDARFLNLGENGDCGIVFRCQGEGNTANYYLFSVNNTSYRLLLRFGGEWHTIQNWQESDYIKSSPAVNRLKVACRGSQIDVYANGQLLGSYIDNILASGIFGLEASEANTHVHFDNLVVYSVTASEVTPEPYDSARQYYNQAVQYRQSGNYAQAITYYQMAIEEYYWYYEAWYEEALVYYETGEYEDALNCYFVVTEIDPQDSNAWVDEGECLEALGRNDEAMSCYNKALELDPENTEARANKDALLERGVPDNTDEPPVKQYDDTRPLTLAGPVMTILLKEGEPFSTTFTVEGGQPPYYWRLITTNGVADNVIVAGDGEEGSTATISGTGAYIDSPSTTAREAFIEIMVEDSSDLTRRGKGSFKLRVENQDDSAIAAQIAREWYAANYGDVNNILQQSLAGVGFGNFTESYSNPRALNDGSYQVIISIEAVAGAEGTSVSVIMDVILTIDTQSREVINVVWGDVRTSY